MAAATGYQQPTLTELFAQTADAVRELVEKKESLLDPLEDEDNFPDEDLYFYLGIWDELLSSSTAGDSLAYVPIGAPESYWITDQMLYNVMSVASSIPSQLRSLTDVAASAAHWMTTLTTQLEGCLRRAKVNKFEGAPQNLRDRIADLVAQLDGKMQEHKSARLDRLTNKAQEAARNAQSSAASASSAAGMTSEATLSKHYDELAEAELRRANIFRGLSIATAILAVLATTVFVIGPDINWTWATIDSNDYVKLIQRGLLLGAILGLAGYFSRQSHIHRTTANWGRALAVQLKTFNAFAAPIRSQQIADELRRTFGARVFGDHPALKGEQGAAPSVAAMEAAVDLATRLTPSGK